MSATYSHVPIDDIGLNERSGEELASWTTVTVASSWFASDLTDLASASVAI